MEENFLLDLVSCIEQNKSQKQINSDIKTLEKTINMLRLTATLAQGSSKKEINTYIKKLSNQLSTIKLKAQIDSKNLKGEVNKALNNVSFKDIDALNIDENKTKIGYEIPFTRYFYKYVPPRKSEDIMAEIMELEKSLDGSLEAIFNG